MARLEAESSSMGGYAEYCERPASLASISLREEFPDNTLPPECVRMHGCYAAGASKGR
jgi:hypothetical protein